MVEGGDVPRRSVLKFLEEAWAVSGGPDLLGLTRHDPKKKYKGECARATPNLNALAACPGSTPSHCHALSLSFPLSMPSQYHALTACPRSMAHVVQTRAASLISYLPLSPLVLPPPPGQSRSLPVAGRPR